MYEEKNPNKQLCHFLANFPIDLDEILYTATTCLFAGAHAKFIYACHSVVKLLEATKQLVIVDYVKQIT